MMKKYICGIDCSFKTMSGDLMSFRRGDEVISMGSLVLRGNGKNYKAVCFTTSQNRYDYFAINDDGLGLKRFDACRKILGWVKEMKAHVGQIDYQTNNINNPHYVALVRFDAYMGKTPFMNDGFWTTAFYDAEYMDLLNIMAKQKELYS